MYYLVCRNGNRKTVKTAYFHHKIGDCSVKEIVMPYKIGETKQQHLENYQSYFVTTEEDSSKWWSTICAHTQTRRHLFIGHFPMNLGHMVALLTLWTDCEAWCLPHVMNYSVDIILFSSINWFQWTSMDITITKSGLQSQYHYHTYIYIHTFYSTLDFVRNYPGELVPEPIWILLKQETVSGISISWDIMQICTSPGRPRQITTPAHHSIFYRPDALPAAQPTASKHW